jgi:hypothetical protein
MDQINFPTTNLPLVALLIGALLAGVHLFGLVARETCITWARTVPRSRFWGTTLLALATLWTLYMTATTDLGEFSPMRNSIMIGVVAAAFLLWKFAPDFLSSRSLGFLLLLAAHPVLETTFLQHGVAKIALALLAYGWALAGLFLVGMPYLHRDLIGWICTQKWRWDLVCWAGMAYGILLLISGLLA